MLTSDQIYLDVFYWQFLCNLALNYGNLNTYFLLRAFLIESFVIAAVDYSQSESSLQFSRARKQPIRMLVATMVTTNLLGSRDVYGQVNLFGSIFIRLFGSIFVPLFGSLFARLFRSIFVRLFRSILVMKFALLFSLDKV